MPRRKLWVNTVPASIVAEVDLDLLAEFGQVVRDADLQVREIVHLARHKGFTWREIGEALGVTASAVCQRFGRQDTSSWVPWDVRAQRQADRAELLAFPLIPDPRRS